MKPGFVSVVRVSRLAALIAITAVAACGGDDGTTDPTRPRAITRVSADSQTTAAGVKMAQPLVVLVTGGGGTPISGASVQWTIGAGGGTVSDSVSATDAAGHAQTTYTPGTAPAVAKVTANVAGLSGVTFTITLIAGPPATLQKFGFSSPAAVAGSKLSLSVKLVDAFGNGISGKAVNWSNAGGSISATSGNTDTGGVATVTFTLGSDPGTYSLTASADGVPSTTFTVKAI